MFWRCIGDVMDLKLGDRLVMKKKHPCGADTFLLTRIGMDIKMKCEGCGRELMLPRSKVETAVKRVIHDIKENNNV